MEEVQTIIPVVVMQHADEAAFLWLLRDGAVSAPLHSLADLAKLDNRVEAHLDGLRIAGPEGWRVCAESLKWEEAGEVFAAAILALDSGDQPRIQQVLKIVAEQPALSDGLVSALGWLPFAQGEALARTLLPSESPVLRRVGLAAFAVQRQNPAAALSDALRSEDLLLNARACKAVGELGRVELVQQTSVVMLSEDPGVRFWSAW